MTFARTTFLRMTAPLCGIALGASLSAWLALSPALAVEAEKAPVAGQTTPTPVEGQKAPSKAEKQVELPPKTKMALKLAGLVTFVAGSCPDLKPDYARFKSAVATLGVSVADLDKTELKGTYLSYMLRYKENPAKNCARALKDFGPGGTVVADLVRPNR